MGPHSAASSFEVRRVDRAQERPQSVRVERLQGADLRQLDQLRIRQRGPHDLAAVLAVAARSQVLLDDVGEREDRPILEGPDAPHGQPADVDEHLVGRVQLGHGTPRQEIGNPRRHAAVHDHGTPAASLPRRERAILARTRCRRRAYAPRSALATRPFPRSPARRAPRRPRYRSAYHCGQSRSPHAASRDADAGELASASSPRRPRRPRAPRPPPVASNQPAHQSRAEHCNRLHGNFTSHTTLPRLSHVGEEGARRGLRGAEPRGLCSAAATA
jgi:hypothetical protein